MSRFKFFTGRMLIAQNEEARKRHSNRQLSKWAVDQIKEDTFYPIGFHIPCNDFGEIRCEVILNREGSKVQIDIPLEVFNHMPSFDTVTKKFYDYEGSEIWVTIE